MYHIKNDKRSQTSAKLISEGLLKCLNNKEFSNITITEVQQASLVGRATFYRLFDNLTDVLAYQSDQIFDDIVRSYNTPPNQLPKDVITLFADNWIKHDKLLETIVKCNRLDIIIESHRKNEDSIKKFFFPNTEIETTQSNYLIVTLSTLMTGILSEWIRTGKKEDASQLCTRVQDSIKLINHMIN
jgi:AcrR family transcriptional regulator